MKLSDEQQQAYRDKGYVILPALFSAAEVAVLDAATNEVLNRDGPEPRGIVVAVFLDEVNECNAPLLCVPGSHYEGLIEAAVNPDGEIEHAARSRYDISRETMASLVERFGVEAVMGPAGSVLFMDGCVVHGSSVNMTPLRRAILYINITDTDNRGNFARPEYQAARDFSPLRSLEDDCLMKWSMTG